MAYKAGKTPQFGLKGTGNSSVWLRGGEHVRLASRTKITCQIWLIWQSKHISLAYKAEAGEDEGCIWVEGK